MRVIVVGLGVQGAKRRKIAGQECVATVDPVNPEAQFKDIKQVPLESYDAALLCIPDQVKFELISYCLKNKKHVLVEKPILGETDEQILSLTKLAAETGTTCYTAYNHRFEPHIMNMKQLLDSGELGNVYAVKLFYGNGTARDVRNSVWRDKGAGVLPDLGSHMLDMLLFWFGNLSERNFEKFSFNTFENKAYDHFLVGSQGKPFFSCEATLLSWRNHFTADIFAEKGSAHISSLCKWGPTTFSVRHRVLPSGKPPQEHITLESADPTWATEYDYFKNLCSQGGSNIRNDLWINQTLNSLARS